MPNGIFEYQGFTPGGGYTTPDQIKAQQDYAKALMTGSGQQPVHHWTQGVSNMVAALAGRNLYDRVNQEQIDAMNRQAAAQANVPLPGATPDATGMSPAMSPAGAQQKTSFNEGPASGGQTNPDVMSKYAAATSSQESGGNYNAVGPVTHTGDRALGKFQVMASNVPEWTQATLGKAMTPEEFLHNPQAQEAVYKAKFGEYVQKYGPEGAAKAWFAGEKGMNHPERRDQLGTSVADYGNKFMALAGPDATNQNPAVSAIANALRGGTQVAANGTKPMTPANPLPVPQGAGQYVQEGAIPRQPHMTREQIQEILVQPGISEPTKNMYMQMYLNQNQPISVPYLGGTVVIDPVDHTKQQYFPNVHWGQKDIGGVIKRDEPQIIGPQGQPSVPQTQVPGVPTQAPSTPGPGSSAAPVAPPATATQGPGAGPAVGTPPVAQNSPVAAPSPANGPQTMPAAQAPQPVKVASTDPTIGIANAGAVPKSMPPSITPPTAPPAPSPEQTATTQKLAGALDKPPPGVSPDEWAAYKEINDFKNQKELDLAKGKADIDIAKDNETHQTAAGWKDYEAQKTTSNAASDLLTNVDTALNILNDPRMHTGILAGAQDVWSRLKEAFGEKAANAPNEFFDKLAAGSVLGALRPTLQGTGQVRLMEVQLLQKANASRFYGDAANRAVLELSHNALTKSAAIGQMADQYVNGQDVTDPEGHVLLPAGQGKRHGLDAGFNQVANKWIKTQNELVTEKYKDLDKLFTTGQTSDGQKLNERPTGAKTPPANPGELKPGHIEDGHKFKGGDPGDPANWEKVQ